MFITRRIACTFVLFGTCLACNLGTRTRAASLVLDTGKTSVVTAGTGGVFSFSTTNADAGDVTNFLSWTLGIQVLPAVGSTGTVSVGTLTAASTNPMPVGSTSVTQPTLTSLGTSINGSPNYYSMGIETTDTLGTLVSGSSYNLGSLTVNASINATGTWNLYAVQQNTPLQRTYWTDGLINDTAFSNLPLGQGNISILLGTITAVPEPSVAVFAAITTCLYGVHVRRIAKRRGMRG